jgi:hypothetical protein
MGDFYEFCMGCRLRNISGQQHFFLSLFLGSIGRKKTKNIFQAGVSKSPIKFFYIIGYKGKLYRDIA